MRTKLLLVMASSITLLLTPRDASSQAPLLSRSRVGVVAGPRVADAGQISANAAPTRFRPIATVVGVTAGGALALFTNIAAAEQGDRVLNQRVLVGALIGGGIGLFVDLVRTRGARVDQSSP